MGKECLLSILEKDRQKNSENNQTQVISFKYTIDIVLCWKLPSVLLVKRLKQTVGSKSIAILRPLNFSAQTHFFHNFLNPWKPETKPESICIIVMRSHDQSSSFTLNKNGIFTNKVLVASNFLVKYFVYYW